MKKLHDIKFDLTSLFIAAEQDYKYQPQLTQKLDNQIDDFSEMTILEIVL